MYRPGTAVVLESPQADEMAEGVKAAQVAPVEPMAQVAQVAQAEVLRLTPMNLPCSEDPDLFFAESPDDVELAKSLCGGCRAKAACLAGALERREPWGVWGGELFLRGEIVPRKRARGRPRKDEVAA